MRHYAALKAAVAVIATGLVFAAAPAWAVHPVVPTNLRQHQGSGTGPAIVPGASSGLLPTGTNVFLTATMPGATNGTGCYDVQLEIRPVGQNFTGTPTHSAGIYQGNKSATDVEAVGLVFQPTVGQWKWQARMSSGSSCPGTQSAWALFNGGNMAFEIAPPNVPDLLVQDVALTMNPTPAPNTLEFTVDATFHNRGAVATGPFQWRAYLSTNKTLEASDTLLFTSSTAVSLDAALNPGSTQTVSSTTILMDPRPPPGAYYVVVEADYANAVAEFDETNNVGSTPNYFINGVDLVATSIGNGPANAQPGNAFNLAVSVFNQGVDAVKDANDDLIPVALRIVASRAEVPSASDQEVYSTNLTFSGGQVHNLSIPIVLPPGIAGGDVYWAAFLDPANAITEALETNNSARSAATSKILQADLQMVATDLVDLHTGQPVRVADFGEEVKLRVSIKNVGNFDAIPTDVGMAISRDASLSLISDQRIGFAPTAAIPMGQTVTFEVTTTLPTQDKQGNDHVTADFYFFALADEFNAINEINEADNYSNSLAVGPVRLRTPAQDYAVTRVRAPLKAAAGDTLFLERQIRNLGTSNGQPVEYACYASANEIITPQDFLLPLVEADGISTVERRTLTLARGASDSRTETVRVPGELPGRDYYIGCIVDPDQTLSELTRDNNTGVSPAPVEVAAQAFQIFTAQVPDAALGQPYQFQLATVSSVGPVTWNQVGVATGMTLGTDGRITGTPTEQGVYGFIAEARSGTFTTRRVITIRVVPPTRELTITTDNLPPHVSSTLQPYQAALSAVGGVKDYQWQLVSGTLPNGLVLDGTTGVVSGTLKPGVMVGEHPFVVRVRDAMGSEVTRQLRLRILPPGALAISTLSLPEGLVGQDYISDMSATMGTVMTLAPPLKWQVVAGFLPPGLSLNVAGDQTTGLITGKPEMAGKYPVTVQVTDGMNRSDTASYVMVVHSNAVRVSWEAAPSHFFPGDTVALGFLSDGAGQTHFRVFSGELPPGVELSADGKLTGTISEDAPHRTYNFAVEGQDVIGAKGLNSFVLEVRAPPPPEGCSSTGSSAGGLGLSAFAVMGMLALAFGRRRRA